MKCNVCFTNPLTDKSYTVGLSLTKSYFLNHVSQRYWRCLENKVNSEGIRYCTYCADLPSLRLFLSLKIDGQNVFVDFVSMDVLHKDHTYSIFKEDIDFYFSVLD